MVKKTIFTLILCIVALPLTPTEGFSWPRHRPPVYVGHHHSYNGDALAWGVAGLVVGGMLTAAMTRPVAAAPSRPQVVYVEPPPQVVVYPSAGGSGQIFSYPPNVPPGMCRWERTMLDQYGRTVLDINGMPAKVYTLGSCQYPPQY